MVDFKHYLDEALLRLKNAPEGRLSVTRSNGRVQFYRYYKNGKKEYISVKDTKLIEALANKLYCEKVIRVSQAQMQIQSRCSKLDSNAIADIIVHMHPAIKEMIEPLDVPVSEKVRHWKEEKYKQKVIQNDTVSYKTEKGDLVRSKSELIIANKLYSKNIPYRYECQLNLNHGLTMFPDFTIMNPKTGKIIIYEHFGMMDNASYVEQFIGKLKIYAENNYFPGKDFVFTCESSGQAFSIEWLNELIGEFCS